MEAEGGQLPVVTYSKRSKAASFKADPQIWSDFKAECKLRGAEICCVLEALMLAWIEGQRAEATVIKPVTVNMTLQHVVERPRRKPVMPSIPVDEYVGEYVERFGACYRLEPKGLFPGKIGFCRWLQQWIQGHECAMCIHTGERQ